MISFDEKLEKESCDSDQFFSGYELNGTESQNWNEIGTSKI